MKIFRVAIVEDELKERTNLENFLSKLENETDYQLNVQSFKNASTFLNVGRGQFDLILMDIELPDMNGMDAIKRIREQGDNSMVIFVTNMARFAVKGYEVRAFDFIVKPVSYQVFQMKIKLALDYLIKTDDADLLVSNKDGKFKIKVSDIIYIEVVSHTLLYHLSDRVIKASGTLDKVYDLLPQNQFSLCNRCYLVNLRHVNELYQTSLLLDNNETLIVSRSKHAGFLHDLNKYYHGE